MPQRRPRKSAAATSSIRVSLDAASKRYLVEAVRLRRISVSEYVRTTAVPQAQREVSAARDGVIRLTPEEQLAFWNALNASPRLPSAQRELGKVMRGEV